MEFLTNEKLTIVGAAGMIGSNMAQTALMMRLTPHLCLYDPYAPALEGVAEELRHCAFKGVDITFTSDVKEASYGSLVYRIFRRGCSQSRNDKRGFIERKCRNCRSIR